MFGRFTRFITGGIAENNNVQAFHSAVFIGYFLIIAVAALGFFTFFNLFINNNYRLAAIDGTFAAFSIYILWHLRRHKNIRRASMLFIGMLFSILVLFFLVSKPESAAFVWVYCFIIAAFLIYGKNIGLLLTLAFCGIVFAYYYSVIGSKITELAFTNLVASAAVIVLFLRFYETSRSAIFDKLQTTLQQLQDSHTELESKSVTDPLTKIYNRAKAYDLLTNAIHNQERYGTPFSIIFLDIDGFKAINDERGHDIGDDILVKYARLLNDNARKTDAVFRWGGEEFMVLCPNTDLHKAGMLAENLRKLFRHETLGNLPLPTASYGIAQHQPDEDIAAIVKRADIAMYTAKRAGGDRIEPLQSET
ncbi:MAG TPA: GGDEF domain-containing protein [Gammaproteobacteria bacterium]|nr:GGDEF domain-containing protein [Gammaproteobacteria bacterium]